MNIFNIFKRKAQPELSELLPTPSTGRVFTDSSYFTNDIQNALKSTTSVAIKLRAEAVSSTEFLLYKKTGQNTKELLDYNHWLVELFENPNPNFRKNEILRLIQMNLDLYGNAYIYTPKSPTTGLPNQMWVLKSNNIQLITGRGGVIAYKYTYGGKTMTYMAEEVIHLRTLLPSKEERYDYVGQSLVSTIYDLIGADAEMDAFLRRYLANDALPPMILKTEAELDQAQWDLFQQKWNIRLPQHKLLATLTKDMQVDPLTEKGLVESAGSVKDLNSTIVEKISMVFGIPYEKLIGKASSLASAKVNDFSFRNDTIDPLLQDLTMSLTQHFQLYEKNIFIDYVPYSFIDEEQKLKVKEFNLSHGLISINELREEEGLDKVPNGDTLYIPNNWIELGSTKEEPSQEEPSQEEDNNKQQSNIDFEDIPEFNIKEYDFTKYNSKRYKNSKSEKWKNWKEK